jgi:hypothetical protein
MDTLTLKNVLMKMNKKLNNKYHVGVYAADTLPRKIKKPAAIIQNLDSKYEKGSHWTAMFLPARGRSEFFCSYGLPPFVEGHKKFLERNARSFIHNKKVLQQISSTECGKYCLIYLANRMSGVSMATFLKNFDPESAKNDVIAHSLGDFLLENI